MSNPTVREGLSALASSFLRMSDVASSHGDDDQAAELLRLTKKFYRLLGEVGPQELRNESETWWDD